MTNEEFKEALTKFYDGVVFPHYHELWDNIGLDATGTVGAVLMNHPIIRGKGWLSAADRLKVLDVNFIKESIETCLKGQIDDDD